jgi:polyisoprenoid-binding protein YceI
MKFALLQSAIFLFVIAPAANAQAPIFHISHPPKCGVKFEAGASFAIIGTFRTWDATLTCPFTDPTNCSLEMKIQADSVDTGNAMKDGKLKGSNFFDANDNPYITFKSTKIVAAAANAAEIHGDFTIRSVKKPEKLAPALKSADTGTGTIAGTMAFDPKDYGMNKGIPFIKIANRVQVTCDLHIPRDSRARDGLPEELASHRQGAERQMEFA